MDYNGLMCKSKAEGGKRCDQSNPSCRSRASLQSKQRYLESHSQDASQVVADLRLLSEARQKYGDIVVHHRMELDEGTEKLLSALEEAGATPLIVGGAVRDSLSTGDQPKDVDIEVHDVSSMSQLSRMLRRNGYVVNEVGRSFGVLKTTLSSGMEIDISLPRRDNLVGDGHRGFSVEVDPDMNIHDAAARRDFTLNALYYDHGKHVIVDPHDGVRDLKDGILRHVSNAYAEDPLRVLRGVQIASRFNLSMADETIAESKRIKDQYHQLSTERVQEEWHKFMIKGSKHLENGLDVLHKTEWDEHLGLQDIDRPAAAQRAQDTIAFAKKRDQDAEVFGTASFALELEPQARRGFIQNVLVGTRRQKQVSALVDMGVPDGLNSRKEVNRWARQLGRAGLSVKEWETLYSKRGTQESRDRVRRIADIARKNGSYTEPHPDYVTGAMILDVSGESRGGRWVGAVLEQAKRAQDDEEFMNSEGARQWLINNLDFLRNVD